MKTLPIARGEHWFFKAARDMVQDPPAFLLRQHRLLGDYFAIDLPLPAKRIAILHPDGAKQVLVTNNKKYVKDIATRTLRLALGNGLLTNEGDDWRKQRRIAQPAFHKRRLDLLAQVMIDTTLEHLQSWPQRAMPIDLVPEMLHLTAHIVTRTLFNAEPQDLENTSRMIDETNAFLTMRFRRIISAPLWVPTAANRRFNRAQRGFHKLAQRLIDERRQIGVQKNDLLAMLMEMRDEETGEGMSDAQLRDETKTLFAAGHETSANALIWTFYLLLQHPEVMQQLVDEVQTVLGKRIISPEDLPGLPYALQVLQESMRLYPPAWIVGREALEDDVVDGFLIPKGSQVLVSAYVMHRHPGFWPDPGRFDPGRFVSGQAAERHKYAWLPFGAGPRLCIGNHFALMEMQIILCTILQRYTLKRHGTASLPYRALITLKPDGELPVEAIRRD